MNLREIRDNLLQNANSLLFSRTDLNRSSGTLFSYSQVSKLRVAIDEINKTGLFTSTINNLKGTELFSTGGDTVVLDPGVGKKIEKDLNSLREMVIEVGNSLTPLVGEEDENTISIRLPNVYDFDDLSLISKDLQTIFGQVVINKEVNGQVKILSVENGSILFYVSLGTAYAVQLVGYIVTAATRIHSALISNRILSSRAKVANINAERHEFLVEQEEKLLNLYLDIEAESIKRAAVTNPDGDYTERIKNSIKLLRSLMDKNVEVKPLLTASQEVKELFPSNFTLDAMESNKHVLEGQKSIEDGISKEPNQELQ